MSTDAMAHVGAGADVFAGLDGGPLDLGSMRVEEDIEDAGFDIKFDADTMLSSVLPAHCRLETRAPVLTGAADPEREEGGVLPPTELDKGLGDAGGGHTLPPRAQRGASPRAQRGVEHKGRVTAGDGQAAAQRHSAARAATRAANEAEAHKQSLLHTMVEKEQAGGGVKGHKDQNGQKGGVESKRARSGGGQDKPEVQRVAKRATTDINSRGEAERMAAEASEQGEMLAEARAAWKKRRDGLGAEYEDKVKALSPEGRQGVEDAMAMDTRSDKHKVMHVMLQYLMALGIVVHCDTEGNECPFPDVVVEEGKKGERKVLEPRKRLKGECAFAGYQGIKVRPERADEFLDHWTKMHGMEPCPASAKGHTLGFCKRDWETLTEGLSNQESKCGIKFGFVPLPTKDGYGAQFSWTNAFRGLTPMVYRPSSWGLVKVVG
mmetsp:Transcript_10435/g.24508  ORF Transcript_10435/g.24508 Transcript_10435/m.24508 type:complete len:434 (-) Transcript_10435:253-1554(-)